MTGLFSFQTINCDLNPDTKTLWISPKGDSFQLNLEQLNEWNILLSWCYSRTEISNICIRSNSPVFCQDPNTDAIAHLDSEHFKKVYAKLHKVIFTSVFLPQTIIVDLAQGGSGLSAELALTGDLKIMNKEGSLSFNAMEKGLPTSQSTNIMLSFLIGQAKARKWILGGGTIQPTELISSGFIAHLYEGTEDKEKLVTKLQRQINTQSPVTRIQVKRLMLEPLLQQYETLMKEDCEIINASLSIEDWKRYSFCEKNQIPVEYLNPVELAKSINREEEKDYG